MFCAQSLLPEVRTEVSVIYQTDTFLLLVHALIFPFSVRYHIQVRTFRKSDKDHFSDSLNLKVARHLHDAL